MYRDYDKKSSFSNKWQTYKSVLNQFVFVFQKNSEFSMLRCLKQCIDKLKE